MTVRQNLRNACWEIARVEQYSKKRQHRQMAALFEGLGNIIADIKPDQTLHDFAVLLHDSLERNVYNNTKA